MEKLDCRWFRFNVRHHLLLVTNWTIKNQVRMVREFRNGFTLNLCDNDGRKLMRRVAQQSTENQHRDTWGEINGCSTLMRTFITDPQGSCGKVIFSQACHSVHRGARVSLVPDPLQGVGYLWSNAPSGGRVSLVPCPFEGVGVPSDRVSGIGYLGRVSRG